MKRRLIHIDANAYFASIEQQADPSLRGKPVGIIGGGNRTILVTTSYEARAFGVKTGMTVPEAQRLCPDIILVVANNQKYAWTSKQMNEIFRRYTPLVETFSVDESFLDITGSITLFGGEMNIVKAIQNDIKTELGIGVNCGLSFNKLMAKYASDTAPKPAGIRVINEEDLPDILQDVPVDDICGIGPRTTEKLAMLSIRTCGDLMRFPKKELVRRFGKNGEKLYNMARGIDHSELVPDEEAEPVKSVGHSMTYDKDISGIEEISKRLLQLSEMVARRSRKYNITGKTVTLTIRTSDFATIQRQTTLHGNTDSSHKIQEAALQLYKENAPGKAVRLLGVSLSNLSFDDNQLSLFASDQKDSSAAAAMDEIRDKYGEKAITFGTLHGEKTGSKVISPSFKPDGARRPNLD